MIPFGYFRGTVRHQNKVVRCNFMTFHIQVFVPSPTVELNQTILTLSENRYDMVGYDIELFNDNIMTTMVVTHLLTLVAMAYIFMYQTRKLAAKMEILTIKVTVSTDVELCAHLLDVKQVK